MNRMILSSLFLILSWAITPQPSFALAEVKATVTVTGAVITLGDLLENLDEGGDIRVMDSPAPGEKISIPTRYLVTLTRQHKVYWQNSRGVRRVIVTRKGKSIRHEDLRPLIAPALAARKLTNRQTKFYFTRRNARLYLPEDNTVDDITLENLSFDPKSRKFSALVSIPSGNGSHTTAIIRGRTEAISYVPALNKIIAPGQEITGRDIIWVAVPSLHIGRNIIRSKDQVVGLTPRRRLEDKTPLRLSDLKRPIIVTRGKMVSILFRSGKISLTALGKARENGGRGDLIQVINSKSRKIIDAMVIGPGQVQVMTLRNNIAQLN